VVEKQMASPEWESAARKIALTLCVRRAKVALALDPLGVSPWSSPDPLSAGLTVNEQLVHTTKKLNNFLRMKMKEKKSSITPVSNQDATIHSVTRRRFLETSVIAGAGTLLATAPFARTRQAPLVDTPPFYKGMCYQPLPFYVDPQRGVLPYTPSIANHTWIFFGSDIAYNCMEPLWGNSFTSRSGTTYPRGRNDLERLKDMGVNLVRLYDWEPRNFHKKFLDRCLTHGIKVLAPVSNYFLTPGQGYDNRQQLIPQLLNSFSNGEQNNGTDYHPAIAGIIMGNEPFIPTPRPFGVEEMSQFTKDWVALESFPTKPKIGHPQDFGRHDGETYPGWHLWTTLLDDQHLGHMKSRLFLATQPQNPARDLFVNFNGDNMGYVRATYNRFGVPLLFTEIGRSRLDPDPPDSYLEVVNGQLRDSIAYGAAHPEQLLGICHFQFADKVWKCPTYSCNDSEGSFGTHSHTQEFLGTVNYVAADFTHIDDCPPPPGNPCIPGNVPMVPDMLRRNPTYEEVVRNYVPRP
jgi:hypothetical protein